MSDCSLAGSVLRTRVSQCVHIDSVQQVLAASHQHRRDRQVKIVDESGLPVLADGGDAAADADSRPRLHPSLAAAQRECRQ